MRQSEEGFTLIGLLIAVAIIGVLATIAVPKFTTAMTAANTAKVQADLSTLDTAIATARIETGTEPADLNALSDYVSDLDNLKPPKGKVYIEGTAQDVPATVYSVTPTNGEARATLGKHVASDFYKSAAATTK